MKARMDGGVGFAEDVRPLVSAADRDCMLQFMDIDLHDWSTVRSMAPDVLSRVTHADPSQRMPPPPAPAWTPAMVALFRDWIDEGMPARRGDAYAAFYRDLDSYTEYFDVYGRPAAENYMPRVLTYFGGAGSALFLWQALARTDPSQGAIVQARRAAFEAALAPPLIRAAIRDVDDLLRSLMTTHFASGVPAPATELLVDAFAEFGRDRLPLDVDRENRVRAQDPADPRLPHSRFHRMDGSVMWFNWAGHYEAALLVDPDPARDAYRLAALAAVLAGSAFDYVFRARRTTRPEFYGANGERIIRDRYATLATDRATLLAEAYELFRFAAF